MTLDNEDIAFVQKAAIENGLTQDDLICLFRDLAIRLEPINNKLDCIISYGIGENIIQFILESENELPYVYADIFFNWVPVEYKVNISIRKGEFKNYFIVNIK